jgi:peptide/nickel transport system substrate-binding protein
MRLRLISRTLALTMVLGLVAAACGGDDGGGGGTTPTETAQPTQGGQAVFGAEQWPQCLHPLTSCNFATWYHVTAAQQVLPKLMMIDDVGNVIASPVLTEAPSLDNGGLTQDPFTVTYHISPDAVWDDGSPMTSEDVEFTWKAVMNTTGSDSTVGFDKIEAVDVSDPATAVISFSEPVAFWYDLMGGGNVNGYLLKKAAFPDADADKPDLKDDFNNEIPFSGGPWKLDSWNESQSVLVRNDNWWGEPSLLDQVTFIPLQEQPQEIAALLSGEVAVIFPQASNVSVIDQLAVNPNVQSTSGPTNYGDALWLNLQKPPLDDLAVRQALAYAIDRQSVIDTIIKLNDPNAEVLGCLPPVFPTVGEWCDNTDFSQYTFDPEQSISILEGAGWDCSAVPAEPCSKGSLKLDIVEYVSAGNQRRIASGQLISEAAHDAGFNIIVTENDATDLFSNKLPQGDYQMADYASGAVVDPTHTGSYACDQIPTKENDFGGLNTSFYCNPDADVIMKQSDQELDPATRLEQIHQIQDFLAQDVVAIPLYAFVNITAWRADQIAGPVGDWNSASYGTYWNMDQWYLPAG